MRVLVAGLICVILTKIASSESDLQEQKDYLNPVDDHQEDSLEKDQDKRTIFSNHHGWAKHVGVHPSGFKYVIGYGPVDLKYVPVVRPINIRLRPQVHHHKWHVRPLVPIRPLHTSWRPASPAVKPVVPVNVPPPPLYKPVHVHYPAPAVVPVQPVVPVKPIHDHVHVKPVVPVHDHHHHDHHHHIPVRPFVPSPPFEVNKPNLPVLPLGATFPVPVQVPTGPTGVHLHNPAVLTQYAPTVEYHGTHNFVPVVPSHHHIHPELPHLHPDHVHIQPQVPHLHAAIPHVHAGVPHVHALPQPPIPHLHAGYPHVHALPQPPIPHLHAGFPHVHALPQPPIPHLHAGVPHVHSLPQAHLHPLLPQENHDVQTPVIPENVYHQQLPNHVHEIFRHEQPQIFEQFLPQPDPPHFHPQHPQFVDQQLPSGEPPQFISPEHPQHPNILFHQQLPGNVQHLFSENINHGNGGSSSILIQGSSIQPGQSDLQIPLHLPHHPTYLPTPGDFQPQENVFKPSITLEPPFSHK